VRNIFLVEHSLDFIRSSYKPTSTIRQIYKLQRSSRMY